LLWGFQQHPGRLPGVSWLRGDPLGAALAARSVKVLACPLLILHAEDDAVLPPDMGRKVGTTATSAWA